NVDLDEIDIELIAQELDKKEMEQFLYECFGKNHKFSGYILKEEKKIDYNHFKEPKNKNEDRLQKDQIEEPKTKNSQKYDLVKKYMDFLED
ncbi:MAG: hypothetical protein KGD57_03740, partial [Candidatus Lokiarchaeota archaeon]|nr:hypothetical protein [Candidatus Lokiarchaeota archaeon]